ncbi:hypothetical protein DIQ79_15485 [Mycolicibacterium smegmatis]|nr:hypothetical protein EYS45_15070 [Mycolicibacterium smegmatis MC2 155]TBM50130.1 hypothetical protein DIQ85_16455 [Mycolicibacterium smegmatis]TBM61129.1 hypothetical protein DIQ83_16515 [Mycolicibacterium smegmatis]TBM69400.1 hypothetical protein DIQ82_16445 [Mycolicibacterium smegmatis]TBM77828.1 hypothetical protein DIQ80_12835 [Mycolicibacterium smegmatis]
MRAGTLGVAGEAGAPPPPAGAPGGATTTGTGGTGGTATGTGATGAAGTDGAEATGGWARITMLRLLGAVGTGARLGARPVVPPVGTRLTPLPPPPATTAGGVMRAPVIADSGTSTDCAERRAVPVCWSSRSSADEGCPCRLPAGPGRSGARWAPGRPLRSGPACRGPGPKPGARRLPRSPACEALPPFCWPRTFAPRSECFFFF